MSTARGLVEPARFARRAAVALLTLVALAGGAAACGSGELGDDEADALFEQQVLALERGRQRRTIAEMRNIATANAAMRVDAGRYAVTLAELADRGYLRIVPQTDAWGNAWVYSTGGDHYSLTSTGSDGAAGPPPPRPWVDAPYDPDIVLTDGQLTQAPRGR